MKINQCRLFRLALHQWEGVNATYFSVPFTSNGLTADLPGIFVTPDAAQQLPLLIFITGTDFSKEVCRRAEVESFACCYCDNQLNDVQVQYMTDF